MQNGLTKDIKMLIYKILNIYPAKQWWAFYHFLMGGGEKLVKIKAHVVRVTLDNIDKHRTRRQHSWKAIANKTCISCKRKLWVWGLFEVMPSRTSENALLQSRI